MSRTPQFAQFMFAACQRGAEAGLKSEIARTEADFRLAFSQPGYVTFKLPDNTSTERVLQHRWVFARTHGISLGRVAGDQLYKLADKVWRLPEVVQLAKESAIRDIHVWQPDTDVPGHGGFEPGPSPLAREVDQALRKTAPMPVANRLPEFVARANATGRNQVVLDVALVEPGAWWIGWHRVLAAHQSWPGGVIPIELPTHAVSRAYVKMEEALHWSALPLQPGDEWVEIGCAPGGASQALLDHGQFVTGIDPAEVDEEVLAHPRFRHLRKRGADVRRREFLGVNWLAVDINVAPPYTLDTVEHIVAHPGIAIRGMVLTLKLPDWQLSERLPEFAARIRSWGYRDLRTRQLSHNSQEVCIVALRNRALRRLRRGKKGARKPAAPHARQLRTDDAHHAANAPHF